MNIDSLTLSYYGLSANISQVLPTLLLLNLIILYTILILYCRHTMHSVARQIPNMHKKVLCYQLCHSQQIKVLGNNCQWYLQPNGWREVSNGPHSNKCNLSGQLRQVGNYGNAYNDRHLFPARCMVP